MAHEVFISHSSIDKATADAVTAALEQARIRCWIAPRDILPGASWGGAIVDAIEDSKVMVIVFSANSNDSKQVMREVERAVQKDVVVVPFRVEEVKPSKDMEYFLSATHWLDALSPEMDAHLTDLVQTVQALLDKSDGSGPSKDPKVASAAIAQSVSRPQAKVVASEAQTIKGLGWKPIAGLAAVIVLALGAFFMIGGGSDDADSDSTLAQSSSASNASKINSEAKPKRKVGSMKLKAPDSATAGEKVPVSWSGDSARGDHVSVAKTDAQDGAYLFYSKVAENKEVSLQMPDRPGDYEIRYRSGPDRSVIDRRSVEVTMPDIALEVPEVTNPGGEISVRWTAPNNKGDFLAIAEQDSDANTYLTYAYTRNGSPSKIKVPDVASEYELRYISGLSRVVWATEKITVPEVEVSLSLPESAGAGETLTIEWQGPGNKGDFLTVASADQDASEYLSYVYIKPGKKAKLTMPEQAGEFEVRYISGQSNQNWASQTVEISMPEVSIEKPNGLIVGNDIEVVWKGPANKSDYLTIAEAGSVGSEYLSYRYVKAGKKAKLSLPDEPGNYAIRYIAGQSKAIWAEVEIDVAAREEQLSLKNATVEPGKKFTVKWLQKGYGQQYVAIYKPDEDVDSYLSYKYTRGKTSQSLTAPTEPGKYEVRYISGKDKLVWATTLFEVK